MPISKKSGASSAARCRLLAPGWNERTRLALSNLISEGANQRLPVVFDFDNTLVCGDIGEATLAVLARTGVLTPDSVPPHLCPRFRAGQNVVKMENCADVTEYYEALLSPTVHGTRDTQPLANGYAWATQVMEGLPLTEVVNATRAAYEWSDPEHPGVIEVTPGRTAYPVPFFYPEMVELLVQLLEHRFDVWIISASNAWSVRWMVIHALNPRLLECGAPSPLRADHVVGISMLLEDRNDRLYKDSVLVQESAAYARLETAAVKKFTLTGQLHYPVPTYSGKIAVIYDVLGRTPYLVAGDSPGDLPMLSTGRHRLWIKRLNKPAYQKTAAGWFRRADRNHWIIQSVDARPGGGFVA